MIGLAYVGSSNNSALKRLLHYAVSDVSDDVRRAAVTNIGLLMLKDYTQVNMLKRYKSSLGSKNRSPTLRKFQSSR
jgi:26S proteasome regulatory subunit N2